MQPGQQTLGGSKRNLGIFGGFGGSKRDLGNTGTLAAGGTKPTTLGLAPPPSLTNAGAIAAGVGNPNGPNIAS